MGKRRKSSDNQKNLKTNLLILLYSFEKYWYAYTFSDGILYKKEIKGEAQKIVVLFYQIYGRKVLINPDNSVNEVDMWRGRQFVEEIEKWVKSDEKYPKSFLGRVFTKTTPLYYQVVLMELESMLVEELKFSIIPGFIATSHEDFFKKEALKWAGQMPEAIVDSISDNYIRNMNSCDTLVLVADIRRSQDLMTYGLNPNYYTENIVTFLNKVREILHDDYAIFDRSTGDGFIAYFNQYVCEQNGKDYYEMLLDACNRIQLFSEGFFDDWIKHIRKLPNEAIGLSIGVDSGQISFKDIENQLFAVGDACVWATRMCSVGKRGEIIVNNIPYHHFKEFSNSGFAIPVESITKNGESFKAFKINLPLVKFKPMPKKDPMIEKPTPIS